MLTLFDESLLPGWLLESTLGSEHSSSVCLNRNCMNNLILLRLEWKRKLHSSGA
jgi:hypothetical protein